METATSKKPSLIEQIVGNEHAKRGLEIAAVFNGSVLLIGPSGCGKTVLISAYKELLPSSSPFFLSAGDDLNTDITALRQEKANSTARDYESTVLIAEDLTEHPRRSLQRLREEMDREGLPVIASMTHCPCGKLGDKYRSCLCSDDEIRRHFNQLPAGLLDLFDVTLQVTPLSASELPAYLDHYHGESGDAFIKRIDNARSILSSESHYHNLQKASRELLRNAVPRFGLSTKKIEKALHLAQVCAALEGAGNIEAHHIAEAVQFCRPADKLI